MQTSEFPTVTVAIPALNEEKHIESVIRCFQKNSYQNVVQILVGDGGSTDKTCEIVKRLAKEDARIQLIHNPAKIQSVALNLMLEKAIGEVFLRADAHSLYSLNYVESCVNALKKSDALNVGGAQRFIYQNEVQAGIALASVSFFGSGNAKYRNPTYSGFVDTVYLGCFVTRYLKEIGGYKPIPINEDFDVNFRLSQLKENAVYLSSSIVVHYYPRDSFKKLFLQYYKYGLFKRITSFANKSFSFRSLLVPFVLYLLALLCVSLIVNSMLGYLLFLIISVLVVVLIDLI